MSANDRIQWFHLKVKDNCFPNASRLAERFDISHRQAQRDVDCLRKDYGAPLEYDPERKGYYYSEDFSLPVMFATANDADYGDVLRGLQDYDRAASKSYIQMQLPYTALLEITDKMTVMNLRGIIVGEEPRHRYRCEFPSIELFLGIVMSAGADIRVVEPVWLRERLVEFARRVLECNDFDD